MWPLILTLVVLGVLLIVVEVFVPGMILGIGGMLALITATVLAYVYYGPEVGSLLLLAELVGGVIFTIWWFRYVPNSALARKLTLDATVTPKAEAEGASLIGQEGVTLSPLRPSGVAEVTGRRIDVVTEGEMVATGEIVRIVKVEGNRIVVRRKDYQPEISA